MGKSFFDFLNELSIGDETIDTNDDYTTEEPEDAEEEGGGNDTGEETGEETPSEEDDTGEEDAGADEDYSIPDEEPTDGGDESEEDGGDSGEGDEETADGVEDTDSDSGDTTDTTDDSEGSGEDLKELENKMYDSLSDEQKTIRTLELKKNFGSLYDKICRIGDDINGIPKTENNIESIKEIVKTLAELKDYCLSYISINFDKATYLDNNIIYIKTINILRTLQKIIDELSNDK